MSNKPPSIEIVIVGDEILANPSREKNARHLVDMLALSGFPVSGISIVGDTTVEIARKLRLSAEQSDVILVTGGLGPTSDDVTVAGTAEAFGIPLVLDETALSWVEEIFSRRNRHMSESNRKQALLPEGAQPLRNKTGTAPGVLLETHETRVFLMPGVPSEMTPMFQGCVLPRIATWYPPLPVASETLHTTGISESLLYDRIKNIPGVKTMVKYYPSPEGVVLKIASEPDSSVDIASLKDNVCKTLGDFIYSTSSESLEEVVGKLLAGKGLTIAVAESCTGGLIAHRLTNIPGSSRYVLCGVVAYSNESKHTVLGVDRQLIERHGAVSEEVAAGMSEGIRKISGSDIGVSTTGIAGPGGGSAHKPVGMMFCGISSRDGTVTKKLQFVEDRIINKKIMSQAALNIARKYLLNL